VPHTRCQVTRCSEQWPRAPPTCCRTPPCLPPQMCAAPLPTARAHQGPLRRATCHAYTFKTSTTLSFLNCFPPSCYFPPWPNLPPTASSSCKPTHVHVPKLSVAARRLHSQVLMTGAAKGYVTPLSEKVGLKPLYVCPRCSIHTYSNNMIQMQCLIKHNNYLLHHDSWVLKGLPKCSGTKRSLSLHKR
jgi:hypothetical protein